MKALLIYPAFPDTFWSFRHSIKFIRKKSAFPPLGMLTVGAMMPAEWSKRLVDLNVECLTDEDLEWADCVFIGAMVVQRKSAQQTIERCKAAGLKVVAGGPLFTSEYEQFEAVDHFILNEAELTLPKFLADFQRGSLQRIYTTSEYADIRKTPIPMWELINLNRYATMSVQFSRGCPFNCDFCNVTALFGHKPRIKTAEQIIAELDYLYQRGWRGQIFFVDDNFIGNKKYLMNHLLPALIEWQKGKSGFLFNTEASINLADNEDLMHAMVEAGFDTVFIGIETPDEESLAECNKKQNKNRNLIQSVKRIQRTGLQVQGGFIVGFDSDGPSIFQRQIDFIQKSGIVTAMVGLLQAPPGTKLYERLKSEGRLSGLLSGDNVDGTTNIIPKMDKGQLLKGYQRILNNIYRPRPYYQRIKTFLREYKAPKISIKLDFQRFLAFFRTSIRIGIFGKERIQYWNLMVWTLCRCPKLLPLAVTLAIHGHHFRKVCKL
jgi:radical SAM superfamily enzyme YgiQ (UPF0313 family)